MVTTIKKLLKSKSVVTVVALAACLIILFVAYNYRIKQKTNPISVPYAKQQIPARTEVTEAMIGTVKVPGSMVTDAVITNKANIIGKFANYNTFIPAGSMFYSSALVTWESMPDSAWSNIYTDNTIVSLPVNVETTYGNSIFPGDKIDIYYKTKDSMGMLVLGKLIEGIDILAVKDENGSHIFKKTANQGQAAELIFSVPEELHLLFKKALFVGGELIPVPRNKNYNNETIVSSIYLTRIILDETYEVPQDAVDEKTNEIIVDDSKIKEE